MWVFENTAGDESRRNISGAPQGCRKHFQIWGDVLRGLAYSCSRYTVSVIMPLMVNNVLTQRTKYESSHVTAFVHRLQ